jgi:glycosyltransferase involved in cell wall biosynthesis
VKNVPSSPETGQDLGPGNNRGTLLCLSHLRWNFVFQRPQHLMTRAARHYRVIFLEEPIFEDSRSRLLLATSAEGVQVATPVLHPSLRRGEIEFLRRSMLRPLLRDVADSDLIVWCYSPMVFDAAEDRAPAVTVYDCMDELSAFRFAPPELREREADLLARADLVFTGGCSLFEAKRSRHDAVFEFPSSVDTSHFGQARHPTPDPVDQVALPRPRIGFFGVIDERLDVGLLAAMADIRPAWSFVMIGPVVKVDPATLPQRPNIAWLGPKSYGELPAYLANWDVGMMPFAINEATRFISPTKTPEFLAAGLRLVSTPVRDVVRRYGDAGIVAIAPTADTFVAALEQAVAGGNARWWQRVDDLLARTSWDTTWPAMQAEMARAVERRRSRGKSQRVVVSSDQARPAYV